MLEPIIYKLVYDDKDVLLGVELWQAGHHITLSLSAEGSHRSGFRWEEVREQVDKLQEEARKRALGNISLGDDYWKAWREVELTKKPKSVKVAE